MNKEEKAVKFNEIYNLIDVGKILAMRYFMVKIRRAGQETKGTQ
jgi:uncharacterized protein YaiI (UPF0178 family)